MTIEKPCSPGHCLGMLNENMRTDMLKSVHDGVYREKEKDASRSPLEMLISSIDATLDTYSDKNLITQIERNPFHANPHYSFDPESDYLHDIKLLGFQCRELKKY